MGLSSQDTKTVSIAWAVVAAVVAIGLIAALITFTYFDTQNKNQEVRGCYQNKMVWDRKERECHKP